MNSYVLALDLEGTLISNAMSQIPRPGLAEFLNRCAELFPRIVMFTTVKEERFRKIARLLVEERIAPSWFAEMEYIAWHGKTKDLQFVPGVRPHQVLLVDDFEKYVHPGQEAQWLEIEHFDHPYSSADTGLAKMLNTLAARI
ncbi:hypothetical protein QFZ42_004398 [Variovorax paradoxus]|uniref:NIF family HAD-type phosphatase n=1 Tax=Variovorax paradoxus TaxID=34073 RepID=UPI0027901D68|nr:NIF family HAD-type phosphatase [Variovorax paradoxus]MDQ0572564.1 hypothetical protein [Variovorax paradoxus]